MLDGQGRDAGIGHQRTLDVAQETGEERPVPETRRDPTRGILRPMTSRVKAAILLLGVLG